MQKSPSYHIHILLLDLILALLLLLANNFYSFNLSHNIITLKTKISKSISSGDTIFVPTPISPCPRYNHDLYNKRPHNTIEDY